MIWKKINKIEQKYKLNSFEFNLTLNPEMKCKLLKEKTKRVRGWGLSGRITWSFSTKSMKAVLSTSMGCPCLSYRASTKWKKLLFRRLLGGCFSKCALPNPALLSKSNSPVGNMKLIGKWQIEYLWGSTSSRFSSPEHLAGDKQEETFRIFHYISLR